MLRDEENEFKYRNCLAFNWNSCLLNHYNPCTGSVCDERMPNLLFVEQLQIDQR